MLGILLTEPYSKNIQDDAWQCLKDAQSQLEQMGISVMIDQFESEAEMRGFLARHTQGVEPFGEEVNDEAH
ncbi:MAG: hypothetical protein AAFN08_11490 [Cyanobacteria bacterium J06559_3]